VTPYYSDDWLTVFHGDARAVMAEMEPESVNCVVTSPPYWGLRDYGEPGQLGLEPTPEAYVAAMVAVFREVRRVLRSDGTVWLNLGDSYATGNPTGRRDADRRGEAGVFADGDWRDRQSSGGGGHIKPLPFGLKPKDLVGIPWRVAFALQADGWYLRSDIIWAKPNPMPESVTDRPTKAHEYLFLLSKSPRYYFDADAVREPSVYPAGHVVTIPDDGKSQATVTEQGIRTRIIGERTMAGGRNIRSVWTVATVPYPGDHFATFPPKLIEPCIKAGTSERGVCPECGAPWKRVVDRSVEFTSGSGRAGNPPNGKNGTEYGQATSGTYDVRMGPSVRAETVGWDAGCDCMVDPIPATVLDPFAGSGTTGMVSQSLSRRAVLIDLSMDYLGQLMERNRDIPLGLGA
jgi:DNA modification methylase